MLFKEFYLPYCKILPNFLSKFQTAYLFAVSTFKIKRLFPRKSAYNKYIIDDQLKRCNYYIICPVRTPKVDSAGFNMAGKNNGGFKYGGFAEKPPNLTPP